MITSRTPRPAATLTIISAAALLLGLTGCVDATTQSIEYARQNLSTELATLKQRVSDESPTTASFESFSNTVAGGAMGRILPASDDVQELGIGSSSIDIYGVQSTPPTSVSFDAILIGFGEAGGGSSG